MYVINYIHYEHKHNLYSTCTAVIKVFCKVAFWIANIYCRQTGSDIIIDIDK